LRHSNADNSEEQELGSDEEVKEVRKFVPVAGFTSETIRDGDEVLEYFERKGYIKRVSLGGDSMWISVFFCVCRSRSGPELMIGPGYD
jgi:hypothetical protein